MNTGFQYGYEHVVFPSSEARYIEMNIGFIGLNGLGYPIANRLLEWCQTHGCHLFIWDSASDRVKSLIEKGARNGKSPGCIAQQCTVLFSVLAGSEDVVALAKGPEGILENADGLEVWIELSPFSNPRWEHLTEIAPPGLILVDAFVQGTLESANQGELRIEFDGDEPVFQRYRRILESFSRQQLLRKVDVKQ